MHIFPTVERFTTKVALNSREPLANCIGPRGTNFSGWTWPVQNLRRAGRASNVMAVIGDDRISFHVDFHYHVMME